MEKLITIGGIILFLMGLICMAWGIAQIGINNVKNETEYKELHDSVNEMIKDWPVNEPNYNSISTYLEGLENLKHKDREKTDVLTANFRRRFGKYYCEKLIK